MFVRVFAVASAVFLASAAAYANSIVIFDNQSADIGGTLNYGTDSGDASLTNGVIDLVSVINPSSDASYSVTGSCGSNSLSGCIAFVTGNFIGSTTNGNTTTYTYGAGGQLSITGTADGISGTLFQTDFGFANPVTLSINHDTGLGTFTGMLSTGGLNGDLAAALGVEPQTLGGTDTGNSFFNVQIQNAGTANESTNTVQLAAATNPAPEPATLSLIGGAFLLLGISLKRQR